MDRLKASMENCRQTSSQNVLEHGVSVWEHLQILIDHIANGANLPSWWRVPAWCHTPGLLDRILPIETIRMYAIWHDCGKVVAKQVDADGRQHFPGHAAASERMWLAVGGNPMAARLMGMDMDAHLLKADGIAGFAARPEAATLLLTALAEVHSNAAMFGGVESDGFKIKAKHLEKRGRQVVAAMEWGITRAAA